MGGNVALRYAGVFPDMVKKIIAIEGQLERHEILYVLDQAEQWIALNRQRSKIGKPSIRTGPM